MVILHRNSVTIEILLIFSGVFGIYNKDLFFITNVVNFCAPIYEFVMVNGTWVALFSIL